MTDNEADLISIASSYLPEGCLGFTCVECGMEAGNHKMDCGRGR